MKKITFFVDQTEYPSIKKQESVEIKLDEYFYKNAGEGEDVSIVFGNERIIKKFTFIMLEPGEVVARYQCSCCGHPWKAKDDLEMCPICFPLNSNGLPERRCPKLGHYCELVEVKS